MSFIINPQELSFEEILQEIDSYIQSKPDSEQWDTFFNSAGKNIHILLAAMSSFFAYRNIVGRRENYLQYATGRASAIAIAQTLGYSVGRGQNAHLDLTITPTITQTLSKYSTIGSVKDKEIILLEDVALTQGIQTVINVAIGLVKEDIVIADSGNIQPFRFLSENVSEDLRVYIDDIEVDYAENAIDLSNDKYIAISNVFGAVDISYLNRVAPLYTTGSEIKIEFIEYSDTSFLTDDITLDSAVLDSSEVITTNIAQEAVNEIKVNAPNYHETQKLIRGRLDYEKLLPTLRADIVDSKGTDISPAIIELSYILNDNTLLKDVEILELENSLNSYRPFGIPPTSIRDSYSRFLHLDITLNLLRNSELDNPASDTLSVISSIEDKLGDTISLYDIENLLVNMETEGFEYVKTARVFLSGDNWAPTYDYKIGAYVNPNIDNNFIYLMDNHLRKTGVTEPTWSTTLNDLQIDGEVVYKVIPYVYPIPGDNPWTVWSANTNKEINDVVVPTVLNNYMYIVVSRINSSGSTEPTWSSTIGDTIIDNEVIWSVREEDGVYSNWLASTDYKLGNIVIPTISNGYSYQCIGFTSQSGAIEPTWPTTLNSSIEDGKILWVATKKEVDPSILKFNEYYKISYNLTINPA